MPTLPVTPPPLPSGFTVDDLGLLLAVALAAALAYLVARRLLTGAGARLAGRASPRLAALLRRREVFAPLALLAPAAVVALAAPALRARFGWSGGLLDQLLQGGVVVVVALAAHGLLGLLDELLSAGRAPGVASLIHQVFRWLRVANVALAAVLLLGAFTDVPVAWVVAGLGLVAATGSIVFADLLYNLVAGALLKAGRLVAVGDWLEVPPLGIDGQVREIGPLLVVVQNWDNTLATVPPRYLVNNTFRNWQQVHRVGARRVLRTLYLDVTTVRPLDELDAGLLGAARALPGVADVLARRVPAAGPTGPTGADGAPQGPQQEQAPALAGLTNAGLYRAYLMGHLAAHPQRAPDTIWRVTNEDAVGGGLPVVLLAYVRETEDVPFRLLEAELYEHALAAAPRFGLRAYQPPVAAAGYRPPTGAGLRAGRGRRAADDRSGSG
jgi:miniconductance mechanosensitive channel